MKKQNKILVVNIFIISVAGIFSFVNAYATNLNIDAATILNNDDYAKKAGIWRDFTLDRTKIDFSECSEMFLVEFHLPYQAPLT